MHSWNLTNLDVEAKATLETLLRPNYLGLIPRWITESEKKDKKALVQLGRMLDFRNRGILEAEQMTAGPDVKSKLRVRRNEPIRINNKGNENYWSDHHQSLDRCSLKPYQGIHLLARSASDTGKRQPGLGGANNETLHKSLKCGEDLRNYFLLGNEPLRQQDVSKMLTPKVTKLLEELCLGHTTDKEKARILESLQHLQHSFKSVPPYTDFQAQLRASQKQEAASRPNTPSRPQSRSGSRPGTPTRVSKASAQVQDSKEELFQFSLMKDRTYPSEYKFEMSCLPPEPTPYVPPPPPAPPNISHTMSQVYFPGNNSKKVTTYQETFNKARVGARPSSAVMLRTSSAPNLSQRPSTAGGNRWAHDTTLNAQMFESLRRKPGIVSPAR